MWNKLKNGNILLLIFLLLTLISLITILSPCCQKTNIVDGRTEHVLCMQLGIMTQNKALGRGIVQKFLWRIFCVPCFEKISPPLVCNWPNENGEKEPIDITTMEMVRGGLTAPFGEDASKTVGAFRRTNSITFSGLLNVIANDIGKFFGNAVGAKLSNSRPEELPSLGPNRMGEVRVLKAKMFEKCWNEVYCCYYHYHKHYKYYYYQGV